MFSLVPIFADHPVAVAKWSRNAHLGTGKTMSRQIGSGQPAQANSAIDAKSAISAEQLQQIDKQTAILLQGDADQGELNS